MDAAGIDERAMLERTHRRYRPLSVMRRAAFGRRMAVLKEHTPDTLPISVIARCELPETTSAYRLDATVAAAWSRDAACGEHPDDATALRPAPNTIESMKMWRAGD